MSKLFDPAVIEANSEEVVFLPEDRVEFVVTLKTLALRGGGPYGRGLSFEEISESRHHIARTMLLHDTFEIAALMKEASLFWLEEAERERQIRYSCRHQRYRITQQGLETLQKYAGQYVPSLR